MKQHELGEWGTLVLGLYRASHETALEEFQDAALACVRPLVSFDASMWGTATLTDQGIDIHTLHLHRKSPEMMAEYEPLKDLDDAAISLIGLPRATRSFDSDLLGGPDERRREFRDVLRRHDQNHILITTRHDPATRFTQWISLFRGDPAAAGSEEDIRRLDGLAPHLMQALTFNRAVHLGKLDAGQSTARGAAIADQRGVPYYSEAGFDEMLRREWSDWNGGAIPREVLEHFLLGNGHYLGRTLVLSHRTQQGLLFLHARPRRPVDELSPREHVIAQLMAMGKTYKEIAKALERSPATVRNQIRSIYQKMGVTNIAGLIEGLRL